ncbi:MAG: shikimate kinase [Eubacteriales bacterium]|nr:shikimate kinase [Eubacteriales bacterium]
MKINGKTRLIGLIGNPVEHTLSPIIHNGISERMGNSSVYVPFKVEKDGLADAVAGAYELNILGMNVTVPHKNDVMNSLIEVDEAAKQIGAVNTLVRVERTDVETQENNHLSDKKTYGYKGYNTDMLGLQRQIHEDGILLKGNTVVILGAGGAAKAVVYMCLLEGASKVYILNRTLEKAIAIAEDMSHLQDLAKDTCIVPLPLAEYSAISEKDLIVFQSTSIGLSPNVEDVVLDDAAFYEKVKVGIDLIYNPANTKFMQLVTAHGGVAYNALKMLLYQGVIAYELWHDLKVPSEIVEDIYVDLKRAVYQKDNIVLIGFMGSGKTTIGQELAKRLHMQFLDTDAYIEEKAGKSIPAIFEEDGEEYFRKLETSVLEELRDGLHNTIVSTGGGMPLRKQNANLLKEIGKVFYLTAANQVIFDRVKGGTNRPLLKCENPYEKVCALMKERRPLYENAADYLVDTNCNDIDEVCSEIINKR